jgi:hypothetical protein
MRGTPATARPSRLGPEGVIIPSMSFERIERSFTLCPSNSGTLTPPPPSKERKQPDNGDKQGKEHNGEVASQGGSCKNEILSPPSSRMKQSASLRRPASTGNLPVTTGNLPVMIPGTLLQTWMKPSRQNSRRQAPRAFRASPFEPLVHQRNLPKSGTITPLKMDEYYAASEHQNRQQQRQQNYNSRQRLDARHDSPTTPDDGVDGRPPMSEIRIFHSSLGSVASSEATAEPTDWQSLYFSSQRDLHETKHRMSQAIHENRHLKRSVFELQRQLYTAQRNKWNMNECDNGSWEVPGRESKRLRVTGPAADEQRYHSSVVAPAVTHETSCKKPPL